jgi:DNA-binding transcriptional ArsR family regulator
MNPVRGLMPMEFLEEACECLKVMAHPARLRMVEVLTRGDRPVHELARLCGIPPPQACEHLRLLKGHGLLDSRRDGRLVYYHVISRQLPGLLACLRANCPLKLTASRASGKAAARRD